MVAAAGKKAAVVSPVESAATARQTKRCAVTPTPIAAVPSAACIIKTAVAQSVAKLVKSVAEALHAVAAPSSVMEHTACRRKITTGLLGRLL